MKIVITEVLLDRIHPSLTNPRKHFDQAKLAELVASIREKGLMSPLIVRPTKPVSSGGYEIVAGERRWRAAKSAGCKIVPVIVRELDDRQVLEVQMIENLQRDDLSALEEAQGYEQILALQDGGKPVYTVATLAAAIGKSERHVIHRRQLARLKGEALDALEAGLITPSTALVLCRVQNDEVLKQVVQEVLYPKSWHSEPLGRRAAEELIADKYARTLKGAAFNPKDAELVPTVGACLGCAKCSSSNSEFFGEVAEMCYDTSCFQHKLDALWQRQADEAKKIGAKVLTEQETKDIDIFGTMALSNTAVILIWLTGRMKMKWPMASNLPSGINF
jgi:ParB/RepB/Spo0J family partition protein